jgi:hypothetical protein
MKKSLSAALLFLTLLAGCSTEYHVKDSNGGYSETSLSPGVWRVTIDFTPYTLRQQIADFLQLRSAELTLQQGYTHFSLADQKLASAEVHMFKGQQQGGAGLHDARAVCARLGDKYETSCR